MRTVFQSVRPRHSICPSGAGPRGRRTSLSLLCMLASALACTPGALAIVHPVSGPRPHPERGPAISLTVSPTAAVNSRVQVSGKVLRSPRGAKVLLVSRAGTKWITLGHSAIRNRQFAVSFNAPAGTITLHLRSVLVKGEHRLASSPVRVLRVLTSEPSPANAAGPSGRSVATPLPGQPSSPPGPPAPVEPGAIDASLPPVSVMVGSSVPVALPQPLASIAPGAEAENAPSKVSIVAQDGGLAVSADMGAATGFATLVITGEGCTSSECGIRFSLKLPLTVEALTNTPGTLDSFTQPSPDRLADAENRQLRDELLFVLGTPTEPGSQAEGLAAANGVGGVLSGGLSGSGVFEVRWSSPQDLDQREAELAAQANVTAVNRFSVEELVEDTAVPTAPVYDRPQWLWPYEQVDAEGAWDLSEGSSTRVGVIDVGNVYEGHEDLNLAEVVNPHGGYAPAGHATHVAGLACARANDEGVVGMAWGCPIISAAVGEDQPTFYTTVLEAMELIALDASVKVVNISLGHQKGCVNATQSDAISAEYDKYEAMYKQVVAGVGKNVVWTISAGNNCAPENASPMAAAGDLANVIVVAATNSGGELATFSNYEPTVSVAAPGGVAVPPLQEFGPMSTWVSECNIASPACACSMPFCTGYAQDWGTSMAAPQVAGVAADVWAAHPEMDGAEVAACIKDSAGAGATGYAKAGSVYPRSYVPLMHYTGAIPIVNAAEAVKCQILPPPPGLPGRDGTIVGQGPTNGVLWRYAGGSAGTRRGSLNLIVNRISYAALDRGAAECISKRYVLRDFVSRSEPPIADLEGRMEAPCPDSSPVLSLPGNATHWILRMANGHAWFLNGESKLEPIPSGGDYIHCAQHYLVLDDVSQQELDSFASDGATSASCSPLRVSSKLPGVVAGVPYEAQLKADGGNLPYSWSIVGGSLPSGLSMSADGKIEGTTTELGPRHLSVQVTDGKGQSAEKTLPLNVFDEEASELPWDVALEYPLAVGGYSRISCGDDEHCLAIQERQMVYTSDGGRDWESLQLSLPAGLAEWNGYAASIACEDATHCLVLFQGPSSQEMLRWSANGKSNWSIASQPDGFRFTESLNCTPDGTCAGIGVPTEGEGEGVLLLSEDFGVSWHKKALPAGMLGGALNCSSRQTCVVTGSRKVSSEEYVGVVAVTQDGGDSWTSTTLAGVGAYEASCASLHCVIPTIKSETGAFGETHLVAGVEVSDDGGSTWVQGNLPAGAEMIFRLSCHEGGRCVGLGRGPSGSVFRSEDGGLTWAEQQGIEYLGGVALSCPSAESCFISGSVLGGGGTLNFSVVYSHDGGSDWDWQEVPLVASSDLVACSSSLSCLFGNSRGNVALQTADGGETWTTTGERSFPEYWTGYECLSCTGVSRMQAASCPVDGSCWAIFDFGFFYGASPNSLYRLIDNQWGEVFLPNRTEPEAIYCFSSESCLVTTGEGLFKTEDGGFTWTALDAYPLGEDAWSIACSDEFHCALAGGEYGSETIHYSEDGGETWQLASSPSGNAFTLSCAEDETCWATGEDLWKSSDGGKSWSSISMGLTWVYGISCPDAEDCWMVGYGEDDVPKVFSTHNGGDTWTVVGLAGTTIDCPSIEECFSAGGSTIYKGPSS